MRNDNIPYRRVEWIESNGEQIILTDYVPNPNTKIVANIQLFFKDYTNPGRNLFGVKDNNNDVFSINFGLDNNNYARTRLFSWNDKSMDSGGEAVKTRSYSFTELRHGGILTIGNNSFNFLDETLTLNPKTTTNTLPMALFGRNEGGILNPLKGWGMRLMFFRIFENGKLVRNFIPVEIENEGVLYDTVNKKIFSNAGSGRFLCPEEVQYTPIEYIESNSDAWIDTDVFIDLSDYRIECEFMATKFTANGSIFSDYYNGSTKITRLIINSQNKIWTNYRSQNNEISINNTINERMIVSLMSGKITINGITQKLSSETNSPNNPTPIILFNRGRDTIIHRDIGARIYWFKVYLSNELILDMIPVRVGNIGYMYDRLSGRLFGNSGTGEFVLGSDI
jgi:hypothetical protein